MRNPLIDPYPEDVIKTSIKDDSYVYITFRSPRLVGTKFFGKNKPMIFPTHVKLGRWRKMCKNGIHIYSITTQMLEQLLLYVWKKAEYEDTMVMLDNLRTIVFRHQEGEI